MMDIREDKEPLRAFKIGDRAFDGERVYSVIGIDIMDVEGQQVVIAWLRDGTIYSMARTEALSREQ